MLWKVFTDSETGREYCAYTLTGEGSDEEEATKEFIAWENGIDVARIVMRIERR